MNDILNQIDAVIDQRCACGCGRPLAINGPSAWFAAEGCQGRWILDNRDPDRARRRQEREGTSGPDRSRAAGNGGHAARRHTDSCGLGSDHSRVASAQRQAYRDRPTVPAAVVQALTSAYVRWAAQLNAILPQPGGAPSDPRERALAHIRNRNTGPQAQHRVPRRIDPRGSR